MSMNPKNKANTSVLVRQGPADYTKLAAASFPTLQAEDIGAILEVTDTGDRHRWSGTAWMQISVGGASITSNFFLDVAKGLVPGHTNVFISARNPTVGNATVEDVWDLGGTMVYPTAGEQWELVSTSTLDTSAGTGARTVRVNYLDDNYVEQVETVTMNGTTAVSLVATDAFRPRSITTVTAGSTGENQGTITLQFDSGGNPRGAMLASENVSMSSHYTVPAGKTTYLISILEEINKNEDVTLEYRRTVGDSGVFITRGKSSIYQSANKYNFQLYNAISEKSDYKVTAISNNASAAPFTFIELLEVDN